MAISAYKTIEKFTCAFSTCVRRAAKIRVRNEYSRTSVLISIRFGSLKGKIMTSPREKTENSANPPQAGRREWLGLAVLAIACVLYAMDLTVLHLAVPSLSAELKPTSTELLWIVDIYGFLVAGSL